jgi:outer membrane murein-binding lipoprotein Lpp
MYKKKLLPFAALIGTILLTGCSSSQPIKHEPFIPLQLDNKIQLKKTDIRKIQLPIKSLEYIIEEYKPKIEKDIKELDSDGNIIYQAKLRVNFKFKLDEIIRVNNSKTLIYKFITENSSLCFVGDCTKVYKTKDYQNFISEVKKSQDDLHSNIFKYAEEYKESEKTLDNWIKTIKNKIYKPNVKFRNNIIDDVELLDEFLKRVNLHDTFPTKEIIFGEFLASNEKSLTTFLNNKVFTYFYPYSGRRYKKFEIRYSPNNNDSFYNNKGKGQFTKKAVNLKNVNNLYLEHNEIYYYFLPKTFTTNDSNIELSLFSRDSGNYSFRVTNLSNKFIILKSVSLYLDDRISNLITVYHLPPKAISTTFTNLTLPEGTTLSTKITNLNQVRDFGVAVNYLVNSKEKTLYTEKKLRINR